MIEKIQHNRKLFATIIRKKYQKKKGINFFTDNNAMQQVGYMNHKKNHIIYPHKHNKRKIKYSRVDATTEVLIILKGILRVDFYDTKKKYLYSKKLYANDIILLSSGGHGFKVIKDVKMIEVKQGPYFVSKDKVKFNKTNESQIKIR